MTLRAWRAPSFTDQPRVERGILYGFTLSAVLIGIGIILSGKILNFFDVASFLLVLGGTFGATMVQYSLGDLRAAHEMLKDVMLNEAESTIERMQDLIRIGQRVKTEGVLCLESEGDSTTDPFMRIGLEVAVDGQPERDIKRILETEIITSNERNSRAVQVVQTLGTYAPALGLIGTLIGLIQLLGSLNDPSTVGPAMSLALLTTLYGAILANIIFLPLAGKMKARSDQQALLKAMTVEGILSISRQESPIVIEQRLQRFLPTLSA